MFQSVQKVLTGEQITDTDVKKINKWVFNRWLSGNPGLVIMANELNRSDVQFDILTLKGVQNIVKGKIKFIKYPKMPETEKIKFSDEDREIMDGLRLGKREYIDYLEFNKLKNLKASKIQRTEKV